MLRCASAAFSVVFKPDLPNKLSSATPPCRLIQSLLQLIEWQVMDTPDSLLICTAPFILIGSSGWSQPVVLPGAAGERPPLPAARWETSQEARSNLGGQEGMRRVKLRGWGGDECARPQMERQRCYSCRSRCILLCWCQVRERLSLRSSSLGACR